LHITNNIVIEKSNHLGFELVGFSEASELDSEFSRFEKWIALNFHSDMDYMIRNKEKRKDVRNILPGAKSVISLGMNYYTPGEHSPDVDSGKISRYAWGKDYHLVIKEKLDQLIVELKLIDNNFEAKAYVDTGPVMDKAWAVKSGIGWLGKHTNVINRDIGSWFFIASLITNYEFDYSIPIEDFCGSCTACLDACPTNAIVEPYLVDANKCISYHTIENKNDIPEEFKDKFNNWIFGCDICQDVCPWNNKFSQVTERTEFYPANGNKEYNLENILRMDQDEFSRKFKNSPVKRTKLSGLKRNAQFILKNLNELSDKNLTDKKRI
jgi:epoxyqueuosine reductase